jgi:heat shock protein HslJ
MNDRRPLIIVFVVSVVAFVLVLAVAIRSSGSDESIEGEWTVDLIVLDADEVQVIEGTTLTATFAAGEVTGSAGCNTFTGTYETDGTALSIGPLASTQMFCEDPLGTMDQEVAYLALLGGAQSFGVSGDTLELRDGSGRRITLSRS